jgi:hypothetical protein
VIAYVASRAIERLINLTRSFFALGPNGWSSERAAAKVVLAKAAIIQMPAETAIETYVGGICVAGWPSGCDTVFTSANINFTDLTSSCCGSIESVPDFTGRAVK